jgi:hypothetical protein
MIYSPRKAIHEAFSAYVGSPRWNEAPSGMTPQRASASFFTKAEAGVIIAAVMTLPTALRGCALFLNAANGVVSMEEFCGFKRALWDRFSASVEEKDAAYHRRSMAEVYAISDQLLLGYQARVWHHDTERYKVGKVVQVIAKSPRAEERINENANRFLDVLIRMDNEALRPVIFAINEVKEKEREAVE